jgi:deoxyribodipyrimidine photo-lyase
VNPVIVWFRRNLRLADNDALIAAAETGRPIVPVYICDKQDAGGASRWWLHHSLSSLGRDLRELGGKLVVRSGKAEVEIAKLARGTGARSVYAASRYEPESRRQEQALRIALQDEGDLHLFEDGVILPPSRLVTGGGTPYRVFTPFWRAASRLGEPAAPKPAPQDLQFARHALESEPLENLNLLPSAPDWAGGLRKTWEPGETGAVCRLQALESGLAGYRDARDRPAEDGTSRLSPHLHFGELSVRQVWHEVRAIEMQQQSSVDAEPLLRQLYWRDFSAYLLYHFPALADKPLRAEFESMPWSDDREKLTAWQNGKTGFPIVDAGMRQLWETGWMHNRVRMIVASFLVKDLMISWQTGAAWFLDTLVDADLANNSASWQWVAGCGTDAAPYFRVFNPTLQAKKFDPAGDYVRRWVPELADPGLGSYPPPIVDHDVARRRALDVYQSIKGKRTSKQAP